MDRVPFHNRPKIVDLTTETKLADGIRESQLLCGEVWCRLQSFGHSTWALCVGPSRKQPAG